MLAAHRLLLEEHPELLLVLVPRHPERFAAVREMIKKARLSFIKRTGQQRCEASTQVFLGDTMGELPMFYAASDVAFVGGSLVPIGGHNLLEPAALGLPVISGPHVFNAQDIADMFIDLGACQIVTDPVELAAAVSELLADSGKAAEVGGKGLEIVRQNRGALTRLLELLDPLLEEQNRKPSLP